MWICRSTIIPKSDNAVCGPARCPAPTADLPKVISALKSLCSREAGLPLWQRGYYEHVIRNGEDFLSCWEYIAGNPAKWAETQNIVL